MRAEMLTVTCLNHHCLAAHHTESIPVGKRAPNIIVVAGVARYLVALVSMFSRLLALAAVISPAAFTVAQERPHDLVRIKAVNSESLTVERFSLQSAGENTVSLKGLMIPDMAAAQETLSGSYYFSDYDLRVMLLDKGLAHLLDKTTAETKERAAQDAAASQHKGIWRDQNLLAKYGYSAKPGEASLVDRVWTALQGFPTWAENNWIAVIGIVGTVASLIGIWTFWRRFDVVLAGTRSVGKTVFKNNLIDPTIYKVGEPESTRDEATSIFRVRPRTSARVSYRLTICDIGGQFPKWLFERLARRQLWLLPRKMILVLILSPYENPGAKTPNSEFIERQYGWVESLIKGFLDSKKYAKRCKGVLIFVNMFDRYSQTQSDVGAQHAYQNLFQKHIDVLKGGKNIKIIVGSGMRRWNCQEAWIWITRTVSGEVHT